jgi:hypothetical protein
MSILTFFKKEMNRTFSVYPKNTGWDGGSPAEGFSDTATVEDAVAAIYEGSAAEKLVSDRYKTDLSAVAISYTGISVPDGSKIITDDSRTFYCIHADDVMTQGEVLVIALKSEE